MARRLKTTSGFILNLETQRFHFKKDGIWNTRPIVTPIVFTQVTIVHNTLSHTCDGGDALTLSSVSVHYHLTARKMQFPHLSSCKHRRRWMKLLWRRNTV